MHQNNICHRDIKSVNILITDNIDPKVIDFGLARNFKDMYKAKNLYTATPSYSAPEIFLKGKITPKVDIYSFGVLMFEVLAKWIPFDGLDVNTIKKIVLTGKSLHDPVIPFHQ